MCAFVAPFFQAARACAHTNASHSGHTSPISAKRPRVLRWSFDHIPEWVRRLDEAEIRRRAELSMNPPPRIDDDTHARLLSLIPSLAEIDELAAQQQALPAPYSTIYLRERPWIPNAPFIIICATAFLFIVRHAILAIPPVTPLALAPTIVVADACSTIFLLSTAALLLAVARINTQDNGTSAIVRTTTMYLFASTLLLPTFLLLSTNAPRAALLLAATTRAIPLPFSLWQWRDLRNDISESSRPIATIFRLWRLLATLACAVGIAIRSHPLAPASLAPLCAHLSTLRQTLASRFPVLLSILRDPGALHLTALLFTIAAIIYALHILILSTDWLSIRNHRDIHTPLSSLLVRLRLYTPARPARRWRPSAAPLGISAHRADPAMMTASVDGLFGTDSVLLRWDTRPPILDLLEEDERAMLQKGIETPTRDDFEKPSGDPLLTWARPLSPEQEKEDFSAYFDMLGQDDYEYDAESDSWVFSDAFAKSRDADPVDFDQLKKNLLDDDTGPDDAQTVFV